MSSVNEIKKHLESLHLRQGDVLASLRSLDALLQEHRDQMHPQLVHYLSQRSYDKARIWLGQQSETSEENAAEDAAGDAASGADAVRKSFSPPPGGCGGRMHRDS